MAIEDKPRSASDDNEMSFEEFKTWLKKFDKDRDGRISVQELRAAIKAGGGWFCRCKAKRGVKVADKNLNGVIDDHEISNLVEFAKKYLGVRKCVKSVKTISNSGRREYDVHVDRINLICPILEL